MAATERARTQELGLWLPLLSATICDSDLGQVCSCVVRQKRKITQPTVPCPPAPGSSAKIRAL